MRDSLDQVGLWACLEGEGIVLIALLDLGRPTHCG